MKRTYQSLLIVLLVAAAMNTSAGAFPRQDQVAQDVLKAEAERVRALTGNDLAALERMLADDMTYTHSSGLADNKEQFLASLRSGAARYETMEHEGVQTRVYGEAAVLTGRTNVKVVTKGEKRDLRLRFTLVYVRRGGRWLMAAWQSTRLPEQ